MSWKIGVSTGCFYPFQRMEEALRNIGWMGFTVAELFLQTPSEYTPLFARRILRAMADSGLRVHSIHLNMKDLDPHSPYAPRRADAHHLFRQALELANAVQASVVNWHGVRQRELEKGVSLESVWETMALWQEWAKEAELRLTLENVSWCNIRTPEEVAEARSALPDLYFTLDSFQAAESGMDPAAVARAMEDRIATVHLSDFDPHGSRHLVPGRGVIEWPTLLQTLSDLRYNGPLIIELSHLSDTTCADAISQSHLFLDQTVEELNLRLRKSR